MLERLLSNVTASHIRRRPLFKALTGLLFILSGLVGSQAMADTNDNRILWHLDYDNMLSATQRDEIQTAMIKTLARAKERHFVGDSIVRQKIKKEGLNLPACFTSGEPCAHDTSLFLDVHNVDALVNAKFSKQNDEWQVAVKLYRSMNATPVEITRGAPKLETLIQSVAGSLFDLESVLELTSVTPEVDVYINNKYAGHPPISMKLPEGAQTVTFRKAGYVGQTWEFVAEKGQVHAKQIELEPEKVQLTVLVTDPESTIDIDEQEWGKGNESHEILPGDHTIHIQSPGYHDFDMDYKVYPGNPQTVHVAQLPVSTDPYTIRKRGIQKYRFSLQFGYHLAHQSLSFGNVGIQDDAYYPENSLWADAFFNGITIGANYEDKYWGLGLFRMDLGGSGIDKTFFVEDYVNDKTIQAQSDGAFFLGFYPVQVKGHVPFWVMQAEAVFGVGLAYHRLTADIGDIGKHDIARTAFSLNLNLGIKYFFSEESFAFASYDFQKDIEKSGGKSTGRHGMTIGIGYQLPILMRENLPPADAPFEALEEDETNSPDASEPANNSEAAGDSNEQ